MGLSIDIQEEGGYLAITLVGEWALGELKDVAVVVAAESKSRGYSCVLVDASGVSESPPELDRFELGKQVASTLRGIKIAAVYRADYINKLFENTAVNRGASIGIFSDKLAALQWLMEG